MGTVLPPDPLSWVCTDRRVTTVVSLTLTLPYVGSMALAAVWTSTWPRWNGVVPVGTAIAVERTGAAGVQVALVE